MRSGLLCPITLTAWVTRQIVTDGSARHRGSCQRIVREQNSCALSRLRSTGALGCHPQEAAKTCPALPAAGLFPAPCRVDGRSAGRLAWRGCHKSCRPRPSRPARSRFRPNSRQLASRIGARIATLRRTCGVVCYKVWITCILSAAAASKLLKASDFRVWMARRRSPRSGGRCG